MSFNPSQFREVIKCALHSLDPNLYSLNSRELLMLTCAAESNFGTYLYQDDGDPEIETNLAAGPMQIEPPTCKDIVYRVIIKRYPFFKPVKAYDLIWDIKSSIIIARCKYLPFRQPLPDHENIKGMAKYYKRYYNTAQGKSTIDRTVRKYREYCL